jgi:hypothetical protein
LLAEPSVEAQSNSDSQTVGALMLEPLIKISAAGAAGSVLVIEAPPDSGLKLMLRLTGFEVGP